MKGVFGVVLCVVLLFCALPAFAGLFDDDTIEYGIWDDSGYRWGRITLYDDRYMLFDTSRGIDIGTFRRFGHFYIRHSIRDGFRTGFIWQIGPFVEVDGDGSYFVPRWESDDQWWLALFDD